jgi:hypothetical protein
MRGYECNEVAVGAVMSVLGRFEGRGIRVGGGLGRWTGWEVRQYFLNALVRDLKRFE